MSAESEKYNTEESVKQLVGGVKHQRFNNLKAYLNTLKSYKTKLIQRPDESDVQFEIRQARTKQEYPEIHRALMRATKEPQVIDLILKLEKHPTVGDLPHDVDFRLMASKQKEIGNRLIGVSSTGTRNNQNQYIPKFKQEDVPSILELLNLQKSPQTTETATAQAPETLIQKQAQSAVGADPNTIVDAPPRRGRPLKNVSKKRAKDIKDEFIILGLKKRLQELEKIKPEDLTKEDIDDITELEAALSYRMYKKTEEINPEKGEEYLSRVKKLMTRLKDEDYVPPPKNKPRKEGEVVINPSDPMLGVFADKAMREQPAPTQIAPIQAQPTTEEQKEEHEVKLAPAQPQQAQQQAPQAPQSPKLPPKISNILGGSKQPAPAQPQAVVANASATNGSGDKSIGNVREIGLAPFDELAKRDEVIPPESQRQKSLAVFANMKWIAPGGNNNSVLADMSPFQKIDDIEYNLRYGKTFKINAKRQVQDYHKPAMLKRCASLFTQPEFIPNDKVIALMQPSTPIGFAESNDRQVRNVLVNEKEFDKMLPKYSDRPKKYNPLSASHGLESYYPNEMIMKPINDTLQNSSVIIHPDTNQLFYT